MSEDNVIKKNLNERSSDNISRILDRTGGLYTVLRAHQQLNELQAWNTITRVESLYWSENNDFIFVGNRPLVLHLISNNNKTPSYDLNSFASFLNTGFFNDEKTPFKNINIVPPNSTIVVNENGVNIQEISDVFNYQVHNENVDDQFYDELVDVLIKSFSPIKKHNIKIDAGLTGGKDSRIINSVLKAMNADFKAYTSGYEDHPDVIIAKKIAKILDIEHEIHIPQHDTEEAGYVEEDILNRTIQTLSATDGMITGYENVFNGNKFNKKKIILTGQGGEHLRGGYNRLVGTHDSLKGLNNLFEKKLDPFQALINPEIERHYVEHLDKWRTKDENPIDIMSKYYIFYRSGKWSSAARAGYTFSNYLYQPFFESNLNKMLLKIPAKYLLNDIVIYNIVKRLAPALLDVPFYADRWNFEKAGPKPGNEEQWELRKPIIAKQRSKASFNWRRTTLTDMKETMMEEIYSNEKVLDLVNKDELHLLFHTEKYMNNKEIDMFVWNLYTASVLLSNKWLSTNKHSKKVKIELPPTKIVNVTPLNFKEANLICVDGLKIKPKKNKLVISFSDISDLKSKNLYVHTFGGDFINPPSEDFQSVSFLGDAKEYKLEFKGKSKKDKQRIQLFFMCYTDEKRIFNKSFVVNLILEEKSYSAQFKPPKDAKYFKIAIKVLYNNQSKEKILLKDMVINHLI